MTEAMDAEGSNEEIMAGVRDALASCCTETRRLLPDDVLAVPAVQHMLHTFLSDASRPFEDWIMEPRCRHVLSKLSDRIDSADGPAVSANYDEQCKMVAHERMRTSTARGMGGDCGGSGGRAADSSGWGCVGAGGDTWGGGDDDGGVAAAVAAATTALGAASRGSALHNVSLGNGGGGGDGGGDGGSTGERANGRRKEQEGGGLVPETGDRFSKAPCDGVAPAASPWSSAGGAAAAAPPTPLPPQEASQNVPPAGLGGGSGGSGGAGSGGAGEEDGEGSGAGVEDTFDMLMVMSEATKEEAKGRFLRGDYMGAAKKYVLAAETLDERPPPTHPRLEGLRGRLKDLYLACMCNAAVAGFKAAKAAPAPGEAHGLVVDACSKALARGGGKCPKARFWRARVKISQRMYEAAADDLAKAVQEEEEEEEGGEEGHGKEEKEKEGQEKRDDNVAQGHNPQRCGGEAKEKESARSGGEGGSVASIHSPPDGAAVPVANGGSACLSATSSRPDGPTATSDGLPRSSGADGRQVPLIGPTADLGGASSQPGDSSAVSSGVLAISSGAAPAASPDVAPAVVPAAAASSSAVGGSGGDGDGHHGRSPLAAGPPPSPGNSGSSGTSGGDGPGPGPGSAPAGGGGGGGGKAKKSSEAGRWLARVRAKLAEMDADRALAAEQASAREEQAKAGNQRALELAQRRARYGPGHVPRRDAPSAEEGAVEASNGPPGGAGSGARKGEEGGDGDGGGGGGGGDDDVLVWKVPRPPPLKVADRSPAMILNDYSMQAKFQAIPEFEQVTGDEGQPEYVCTISVGPEDRVVGRGTGSNMKAAKQQASRELLTNAALAWNEENPEDTIDMDMMVPLPATVSSTGKSKPPPTEITEEFRAYIKAWMDKVVAEDIHEACFPDDIDKHQRKYVHRAVEELKDPAVLSKSASVEGRRRLSVMRRAMMEGLAFMSGDDVIVVDVPPPPTSTADVGDLASITRPPPERKVAPAPASSQEKETTATAAASASTPATAPAELKGMDGAKDGGGTVTALSAAGVRLAEEGVSAAAVQG